MQPPHAPWCPLHAGTGPHGYVSVYLSDELARYPVRAVTKPRDNKSDPNLETGTYGVFSTCQIMMRKSIATKGVPYVFFVTTHRPKTRVLAGYYRVGWHAPGPDGDHVLAASTWRFVEPIPALSLPTDLRVAVEVRRGYRGLDQRQAERLRAIVDAKPDWTDRYVEDIRRLETLSARHTGYCYPTWKRAQGWSWSDVPTYMAKSARSPVRVGNKAPGDQWVCAACKAVSVSGARLKRCPECQALFTLRPLKGD
jgi:hypothetical protein